MKREPVGNDREQDKWLGNTLRRSPATASDACLDAETLAAWADGGLSAKATAAVELHASSCSRCMAVLATLERTAPAPSATHAWTPARLFRWVAPFAAAATAVAIWVAVPDRPITQVPPQTAQELSATSERTDADASAKADTQPAGPVPVPVPVPVPERGTSNAELGTRNLEPQEQYLLRDEARLERAAPQALGAAATAAPEAPPPAEPSAAEPPAAAPSAAARSAAAPPAAATDSLAETATMAARQSNFVSKIAVTSESTATSNQLFRWRVVGYTSIERSTDGGKAWTKTIPIPGVAPNITPALTIVSIRAISDVSAMARTSDGRDFYTSNGGLSWIPPVQEKPAAPF